MKKGDWRINRSPSVLPHFKRNHYQKVRLKALNILGGKCCKCSFDDERALQIDHVNSDGAKEPHSGCSFFYHVINTFGSGRFQVLCANCNWIKRREKEEVKKYYSETHEFPKEELHIKVFNPKKCKKCSIEFIPNTGRQVLCHDHCYKRKG